LNYDSPEEELKLKSSRNPFALVVRAHLKGLQTRYSAKRRLEWKIILYKTLYEENKYSEREILNLFRFLDWMFGLPEPLTLQFKQFVQNYEEQLKMPYVTSVERISRQEGRQEGIHLGSTRNAREYVINLLQARFQQVPPALEAIDDSKRLSDLHRQAIFIESLVAFERLL